MRIVFLLLASIAAMRAQLPDTDIWLFRLKMENGGWQAVSPLNITDRKGYDNQPKFSGDGKTIWYSSARENNQTDIYAGSIGGKSRRVTTSTESEYSPAPVAKGVLACVVVEKDSSQKVHFVREKDGTHISIPDFDSVGYFLFLNADTLVYFKVGEPATLCVRSLSRHTEFIIGNDPARGMCALNRHAFIYGLKEESRVSWYRYDLLLAKATPVATSPEGSEDIFNDSILGLLRSGGTSIYRYDATKEDWMPLFDLSALPVKKITRFALDRERKSLVVVGEIK